MARAALQRHTAADHHPPVAVPRLFKLRSITGLWFACFLGGLVVLLASLAKIPHTAANQSFQHGYTTANTAELLRAPNAIPVKVGGYIENYHDLSLEGRRFVAEGYYWFEWPQALQDVIERENLQPIDLFEITNQVDDWDSKFRSMTDAATKLANGNYYFLVRFSGNFYIPELNLRHSPFESIDLPIIIEAQDDSLALENANVVLTKNNSNDSLVGSYGEIDGYRLASSTVEPMVHSYGTSWGLDKGDLRFSAMELVSHLQSNVVASLVIWVLPVLIVLGIVLLAPSLAGDLGDIRLAIPSTGMLTLIFLQQTYRTELPALDYLTFLDWIYACAYLVAIFTFLLFVWSTNTFQMAAEHDKAQAVQRINNIDTIFQLCALSCLVVAAGLAWRA